MGMCVKMIKKNQIWTPETVSKPSMLPDKKPLWQEPASFDTEAVLLTTRAGLLHELADLWLSASRKCHPCETLASVHLHFLALPDFEKASKNQSTLLGG